MYSFCSSLDDTAHIPLIQRGGTTVFSQSPRLTTAETAKQPFTMQLALDWQGFSAGRLAVDDGLTIGNIEAGQYNAFSVSAHFARSSGSSGGSGLTGAVHYSAQQLAPQYDTSKLFIQRIVVIGTDLMEGADIPTPTLSVNEQLVSLDGLKMRVVNGAIVLEDSSASILPVGQNWKLQWTGPQSVLSA